MSKKGSPVLIFISESRKQTRLQDVQCGKLLTAHVDDLKHGGSFIFDLVRERNHYTLNFDSF